MIPAQRLPAVAATTMRTRVAHQLIRFVTLAPWMPTCHAVRVPLTAGDARGWALGAVPHSKRPCVAATVRCWDLLRLNDI